MIRTIAACDEAGQKGLLFSFVIDFLIVLAYSKFCPADSKTCPKNIPAGTFSYPPRLRDAWPPPPMKKMSSVFSAFSNSLLISAITAAFVQNT